jgi:uncharacterized protein (TIGR00369 family)
MRFSRRGRHYFTGARLRGNELRQLQCPFLQRLGHRSTATVVALNAEAGKRAMSLFKPKDRFFETRVWDSFGRQEAMRTLAIEIALLEPGEITLTMPYVAAYTQQHGFVHAGILATALDSACGYAAFSLMPEDAAVLTVEFKLNLLAPARGDRFVFRGKVVKSGRTITVCEAYAFAISGGEEKLIATMSGTLMALFDRADIRS